jgi:hypothetical protein
MNVEFVEYRCSQCKGHFIEPIAVHAATAIDAIKTLAARGSLICEPCLIRIEYASEAAVGSGE